MTGKVTAGIRSSRIASSVVLLISFTVPFTWVLSTGLVWAAGRKIPGSVEDTSISFPTGIPLVAIILTSWLACFFVCHRIINSKLLATLASNAAAILAFCACLTFQLGAAVWNPIPDAGLMNIFPIRFALAVLIALACSALAAIYLAPRTNQSTRTHTPDSKQKP
ncbi:hypothetical protein [Rhizobacter sp. Root1221]|uniref:hypothetical protein n=1 Tax=Rhizobacter sp. Root1221 TaxID=1736433 RepID=UPI001F21E01F|nr:hypothetical protein [Rhizobacter sp. Root1221]